MPDLFTMGHWHGEITSNVTFAYCTKWCIGVVVLRGRPLTHVRNLSMKPKPFHRAFSFFFLHENSQRGCIRVRKLGDIKADTHSQQWERRYCKKTDSLGATSLTSQASARLGCAFSCIMTCFSCAAMVFRYSERARTFFTKYVPSRSFGSHVTWNSAVPDPNVWCCILLLLCTLGVINI